MNTLYHIQQAAAATSKNGRPKPFFVLSLVEKLKTIAILGSNHGMISGCSRETRDWLFRQCVFSFRKNIWEFLYGRRQE
jgi:hypothetical protein